jgi:hypothetical protein
MADDWAQHEVEIIVDDYLGMWDLEIRGRDFNKAERNRELQKLLPGRSRGSIEFKHANISAVMNELGCPYVEGYKPRSNFQGLLYEAVERRVNARPELAATIAARLEKPIVKPEGIRDILSILVDPPVPPKRIGPLYERPALPRVAPKRNYLEQEARNQLLGRAGEELVLEFEHKRLWQAGQKTLAERIEHVSTRSDSHGFDILSFETDGRERLVEVKTTRFGAMNPFFATSNEVAVSERRREEYYVYRLFNFDKKPGLFLLNGSMRSTCALEAVQFRAIPGPHED